MGVALKRFGLQLLAVSSSLILARTYAQPVVVTARLDARRLKAGEATTLRVLAQIAPENRDASARIFSWNVDAMLTGGAIAQFDAAGLRRPNSDNDPQTSSSGTSEGSNIRSIRDSFLNRTNAGRNEPIELFSIPLRAITPGTASIFIQAGSIADEPDFVVEPVGDGPTLIGGDYREAQVQLEVYAPVTNLVISISQAVLPQNAGRLLTVSFPTVSGTSYFAESTTNLILPQSWRELSNGPHNLGYADDTNSLPFRFYRVRVTEP